METTPKNKDGILDAVIDCFADSLGHSTQKYNELKRSLTADTKILEIGEMDSLDQVEIIIKLENMFNVHISAEQFGQGDDGFEKILTINDLVEFIQNRSSSQPT